MQVDFIFSDKDHKTVSRILGKSRENSKINLIKNIIGFVGGFFLAIGSSVIISQIKAIYSFNPVFLMGFGFAALGLTIMFWARRYAARKMLEKTGFLSAKYSYLILQDRIIHSMDDSLRQEILPENIKEWSDVSGYILIKIRDNYAFYIPPQAFGDNLAREKCKEEINRLYLLKSGKSLQ